MNRIRQLTPGEVLFVGGENGQTYFHVSGLTILDGSGVSGFSYESFRGHLESRLAEIPHFRWRLHEVPLGMDLPYWVEDDDFSFDHHIRRIAVPSPGDREALGELVAYLYSRHLDRRRPLWEVWFIEGLEDGTHALFSKLHHAMMDGQGAVKLGEVINDLEPDAAPRPIDPAISEALPGTIPDRWQESLNSVRHLSGLPIRIGREVAGLVGSSLGMLRNAVSGEAGRSRPPRASFNGRVGSERGFVFGAMPLDEVKAVKDHFGVTVNDVVLAVVAGSLRRYLLDRDELPDDPLRTTIAVSLRKDGDDEFSNQVTTISISLATDLDDPVGRLRAISAEQADAKARARAGNRDYLELMGIFPPVLVGALLAVTPPDVVRLIADTNLLVSSVRGSPFPLYMGGAKTTAMYPMSIITNGSGLSITCISYIDEIDVGITLEPSMFPEPWALIDGLRTELDGYLAHLPRRRTRAKRAAKRTAG